MDCTVHTSIMPGIYQEVAYIRRWYISMSFDMMVLGYTVNLFTAIGSNDGKLGYFHHFETTWYKPAYRRISIRLTSMAVCLVCRR